jgi:MFS family permease
MASVDPAQFQGLSYRLVGHSRGGRVTTVTGVPSQPKTFYMGVASGGLWRTTNGGESWEPITDHKVPVGSMGSVAVAWEVYDLTRRPLDLGFVGLAQFLPAVLLSLFTGAVADRFDRRRVVAVCHAVLALGWLLLALRATLGVRDLRAVYGVLVLLGTARAFQGPAASALVPNLVPPSDLSNAVAWASTTWQVATIAGPSLGGLSLGLLSPTGVYTVSASAAVFALVSTLRVAPRPAAPRTAEPPMDRLLAGSRYVWRTPVVLGCISLDLFAVLLGASVALVPLLASEMLHARP